MNPWLKTGLIGSIITALCCFTPILIVMLAAIGLGGLAMHLDVVLFPLLGIFLAVLVIGILKARQ